MDIKSIGKIARNSYITDILNSIGEQTNLNSDKIKELDNYAMFYTLNESSILLWENFLELKPQLSWTIEDKRERIIYTINSTNTFTLEFLKEQSRRFSNGEIDIIEDFSNYHFTIQFTSGLGVPSNLYNFVEMIDTNKPAHLTYNYLFMYRTHRELEMYTHEQLSIFTHDTIRQGVI